ncbi:MAG: ParB/RepB/Spo0J family partition protein [Gemmatimonadota bacterium]|uniref:ParB/RepB/Spo0J family partition protein n=1 Tax=Candidatus Palauibacter scopulicola TaxID=3056741 RepID=UPI002394D4B3|nr:ParB/RepB/Spo0J family partition protein [Candidatus Palauibacter scopulicola]MDE2662766.1 ParB/RepB/Spo0J family partition protein [Candidatus Palauibacter scopulicola]
MPRNDRRLGKGLAALLGENLGTERGAAEAEIPVEAIRANPFQPRGDFDPARLAELADSIRENGLLQPVVVRPVGEAFEIVVGERRFRAIQSLGWTSVPALVRTLDDEQMLVVALVENLQRHDLSALEEAQGYRRLMRDFDLTQEEVGRHVGRDRSTVANALRLLALPKAVLGLLAKGKLSAGHGRALLGLSTPEEQTRVALEAVKHGWSVRATERRVRRERPEQRGRRATRRKGPAGGGDPVVRRAELGLERGFGTQVRIRTRSDGAGEVVVRFHDTDDFLRLVALMGGDELAAELRE